MSDPEAPPVPQTRWNRLGAGGSEAAAYQRRFDDLAASGQDVHGEADLVESLVTAPARLLDAGCGTGRVAAELTRRGYRCTGVDAEADMISVARRRDPVTQYAVQDLASLDLDRPAFDLVLLAGNVVPLLWPGTLSEVVSRVVVHTRPGGWVLAGFGLDAAHLPRGCPVTAVEDYDAACLAAGLTTVTRHATWDRRPWSAETGYVVALHHRA